MELVQDRGQWRDLVLAVLNLRVLLPDCQLISYVGISMLRSSTVSGLDR
jgi:hypothetical protein